MMMAPEQYVEQFENASYQEILKVKKELVSDISKFEHDYDREDPDWNICPNRMFVISGIWKSLV